MTQQSWDQGYYHDELIARAAALYSSGGAFNHDLETESDTTSASVSSSGKRQHKYPKSRQETEQYRRNCQGVEITKTLRHIKIKRVSGRRKAERIAREDAAAGRVRTPHNQNTREYKKSPRATTCWATHAQASQRKPVKLAWNKNSTVKPRRQPLRPGALPSNAMPTEFEKQQEEVANLYSEKACIKEERSLQWKKDQKRRGLAQKKKAASGGAT